MSRRKPETVERLTPTPVTGDPRTLTLLDRNARFMTHEQFKRLCDNVRRDGCLTSTPLVWHDSETDKRIVLSGNHRVKAAVEVELESIVWLELTGPLPRSRRIAMQLAHNAIEGQDDPDMLKSLYDELGELEERAYSGLDDKMLDLMEDVDTAALSEANLDFTHVQLMFLPDEVDRVRDGFEAAVEAVRCDERWTAHLKDHEGLLDALATAGAAHAVSNTAVGLGILLAVVEAHLGDLRDGWFDESTGQPRHKGGAPLETLFGTRMMPTDAAATVARAIDKMVRDGDVNPDHRWQALEAWAADYLGGA